MTDSTGFLRGADSTPSCTDGAAPPDEALRVLYPTTLQAPADLPDIDWLPYDPMRPSPAGSAGADVLVVWETESRALHALASALTSLRLVQLLTVGYEQALGAGFSPSVAIANGQGLHTHAVVEHTLALLLGVMRRIPEAARAQHAHEWSHTSLTAASDSRVVTTLKDAQVTIWGYGAIGSALAPHLTALGARVTGVRRRAERHPGNDFAIPVVAERDIDDILPMTDVLIMILPSSPQNRHALDARRLALLPSHALVVNVGRGDTIDEPALVDALASHRIGGGGLDVTTVEPLPAGSPLWDLPNVLITPHSAGGYPRDWQELVQHNVRSLVLGQPLHNVVRPAAGSATIAGRVAGAGPTAGKGELGGLPPGRSTLRRIGRSDSDAASPARVRRAWPPVPR